jgi:UDP-glucose 4-epimerase
VAGPRRILITGVASWWGMQLAERLLADGQRVVGLDTREPPGPHGITFVRADLRERGLAEVVRAAGVDTVVHNDITQYPEPGRSARALHDINVIGTLQLLAACAELPALRTLVVRGSSAIYGSEGCGPSFFTEEMARRFPRRFRFQRDVGELEALVDSFARRSPGVTCCVLRLAPQVGPGLDSPVNRLLRGRLVPTVLGYDPRVQLLDAEDAVAALHRAVLDPVAGPVNVAAEDVVPLSGALRAAGRLPVPVAGPLYGRVARGVPPELQRFMRFGRAMDTTRMREALGFRPAHTTAGALARAAA